MVLESETDPEMLEKLRQLSSICRKRNESTFWVSDLRELEGEVESVQFKVRARCKTKDHMVAG